MENNEMTNEEKLEYLSKLIKELEKNIEEKEEAKKVK